MAATILIKRWNGSSGSPTTNNITAGNTRCNAADVPYTTEYTNPIAIPSTGYNFSYWCCTRLYCSAISGTTINNLLWFSSGTNTSGTGVTIQCNTASSYIQATGSVGATGDQLTTSNYSTLASSPVNAFGFTFSAPLVVAGSTTTTGDFGNFVVYQFTIASTALPGATTQQIFSWQYDEA